MKGEVYSWRVSREVKMALEREARQAGVNFATLLDRMAQEWLQTRRTIESDEDRQARIHSAASELIGSISGGQPHRAERSRETVRAIIRKKHGR